MTAGFGLTSLNLWLDSTPHGQIIQKRDLTGSEGGSLAEMISKKLGNTEQTRVTTSSATMAMCLTRVILDASTKYAEAGVAIKVTTTGPRRGMIHRGTETGLIGVDLEVTAHAEETGGASRFIWL